MMESVGLPCQPWKVVKGMTALREYLKTHENTHCKIDRWRGVTESFFSPNYEIIVPKLDEITHTLGAFQEVLEFIVEDDLPDMIETGIDSYCIDGEYPSKTLMGIEVKDIGFLGQIVDWAKIPEPITRWNDKMAPFFAKYGYRGFLSNEIRIGKELEPYCIDPTCRAPCPPSELWQELYGNLADILWYGAEGIIVDPEPIAKWGCEIILKSAWAEKNHQPVFYPPKYANQIKLFNSIEVDKRRYVIPQDDEMTEIGAVVGWGATMEEAIEHAKEAGDEVEGYGIKFNIGNVDKAKEQIAEMEEMGISPFDVVKSLESETQK
jgi:hypothetical protein